jgi:putative hydrolase of the HAD superfamily
VVISAVVFDLDDTLFEQRSWLDGAWRVVADAVPPQRDELLAALVEIAAEGSDRGRIIDRALERIGALDVAVAPLVDAFRRHAPLSLPLARGAIEGLRELRRVVPVGLVTDGDPVIQRAKLVALDVVDELDAIVISDELGRDLRKPHPAAFVQAAAVLGVPVSACVYVGDRPSKDVAGARAAGYAGCVRVRTGEHAAEADLSCIIAVDDLEAAFSWLRRELGRYAAPSARSGGASATIS